MGDHWDCMKIIEGDNDSVERENNMATSKGARFAALLYLTETNAEWWKDKDDVHTPAALYLKRALYQTY